VPSAAAIVAHRSFSSLYSSASARRRACSAGVHREPPPGVDTRRFRGDVPIATDGDLAGELVGRSFAGDFVALLAGDGELRADGMPARRRAV